MYSSTNALRAQHGLGRILVALDVTAQLVLLLDHRADGSQNVVVAHRGAFHGPETIQMGGDNSHAPWPAA